MNRRTRERVTQTNNSMKKRLGIFGVLLIAALVIQHWVLIVGVVLVYVEFVAWTKRRNK